MTALTISEEQLARAAVEENEKLRRLLDEHHNEGRQHDDSSTAENDIDSVFALRRKNDVLRGEVTDLQDKLTAFDTVSAVETVHEYKRLEARRAHLRNEVQSLRNIKAHQLPKVRQANRTVNELQQFKKKSDERNRIFKDEIKRLKERREKEMDDLFVLNRKEAQLKEQLEQMNMPSNTLNPQELRSAVGMKEQAIQKLEEEIQTIIFSQRKQNQRSKSGTDSEIISLRDEYASLLEKIEAARQEA